MQVNQVKQVILLSQIVSCPSKGETAHWSYLVFISNNSHRPQRILTLPSLLIIVFLTLCFSILTLIVLCCWGLPCTLWDHFWSLPTKCQKYSPSVTTKNVPRHSLMSPGEIITTQPTAVSDQERDKWDLCGLLLIAPVIHISPVVSTMFIT